MRFPTGGLEEERGGEKEATLLSCGIARLRLHSNYRVMGFKMLQYSCLFVIITFLQCPHLAVHQRGEGKVYFTVLQSVRGELHHE